MSRLFYRASWLAIVAALFLTGCPDDGEEEVTTPDVGHVDASTDVDDEPDHPAYRTADCDSLMEAYCSMPWPSNLYLQRDVDRATGYTIDFGEASLPKSQFHGHIEPDAYRRLDGYGWGTPVVVLFPGVDISQMPAEDSIERSMEDDDLHAFYFKVTDSGLEPVPFWAELDLWTHQQTSAEDQVLYLRPAVILEENTRYIVGFRNLADEDGESFERSEAFEKYLSGAADDDEELAWRQESFTEIFRLLEDAGVDPDELTLAWDFHTGSSDGLHSTLLQIVADGIAAADEEGIDVEIRSIQKREQTENNPYKALEIRGTFRVPHFLEHSDRSGMEVSYLFHRDEHGMPAINDWREATFWLSIPFSAVDGEPHGLVTYGHGMLGSGSQVTGSFNSKIGNEHNLIHFGADFIGFSGNDVPQAIEALQQPTYFEELVDRMHQGVLEFVLLTKTMKEQLETVIAEHEDLQDYDIVVDHDRIYYTGISQGGIYGATVLAVDPLIERGHLGVPGHNYAMLMERSTNFDVYYAVLRSGFPDRVDQSIAMPVIQLLWDQIDPISYIPKLTHSPFNPEKPKYALFATAKADYQVAVVTNEISARSGIGIPLLENYDREREPWGVDWAQYPHQGSGVVNYDFGNPWPPIGNVAPGDEVGDPHGLGRNLDVHNEQLAHFLDTGEIIDVCDGAPCYFPEDLQED